MKPLEVFIADSYPVTVEGLSAVLSQTADLVVAGHAGTGEEALAWIRERQPDVALLSCNLSGLSNFEVARFMLEHPLPARPLILSARGERACFQQMIRIGVKGYVLKTESSERILQAIRAVWRDESWFSTSVVEKLALANDKTHETPKLTHGEWAIFQLACTGWSNRQIAGHLCLHEQSVKNTMSRVLKKLGVKSRAQAIRHAYEQGFFADRP